jgi:hypothetical protein
VLRYALALCCGLSIASLTLYQARRAPQFADYIDHHAYDEIRAWIDGTQVRASKAFGPAQESQCGIFYLTHHPLLGSYLAVAAGKVGYYPRLPTQLGIALLSGAFVASCCLVSAALGLGAAVLLVGYLLAAPGYYEWLSYPVENTWAFSMYFAAGLAGVSKRWLWIPAVSFLMACFSIDAVVWHAAIVAGVTVAAYGLSLEAVGIGLFSVLAYCLANVLHLIQVTCHFDWNLHWTRLNYFGGYQGHTSLLFRVTKMSAHQRWAVCHHYLWLYLEELFRNRHAHWTTWPIWILFPASCVFFLAFIRDMRGTVGIAVFAVLFLSAGFFVPGLITPHLHYLVRYLLLFPIGLAAVINSALWARASKTGWTGTEKSAKSAKNQGAPVAQMDRAQDS